jgi:hypothetical protein
MKRKDWIGKLDGILTIQQLLSIEKYRLYFSRYFLKDKNRRI